MTSVVRHHMGMPISVVLRDEDADVDVEPAFAWLAWVDATFSTYRADSQIARLDRGELLVEDCAPEVGAVLERCRVLNQATGGFFSVRPEGRLDPSGFVKGWALAGFAQRLAAAGAATFLADAGGDVVARGGPWRVGIRHPLEATGVAAVLAGSDLAVATSGAYERGEHIRDPHTGRPPAGLLSVTITGPAQEIADADAYATAAFAMGTAGPAWAATLDGFEALSVTTDRRVLTTPGMDRLLAR